MNTMNVAEAARYMGVCVKTLQRWDREGRLVAGRYQTNRRYYTSQQCDEFMGRKESVGADAQPQNQA